MSDENKKPVDISAVLPVQVHSAIVAGIVKTIKGGEEKDGKQQAAILMVQYGKPRSRGEGNVEFVNAVLIRVPGYLYGKVKEKMDVGSVVRVDGHIQGVVKTVANERFFTIEMVADRIAVAESDSESSDD